MYEHIWKTDQYIPQTNHRKNKLDVLRGETKASISCWFWSIQLWQRRNEAQSNRKTPKSLHSCSFQFWNKRFSKSAIRRNYNLKLDQHMILLLPVNNATTFTYTMKKKRSVSKFFHLCLNNIWAPFRRLVCITRISCFSSLPRPETLFRQVQDRQRAAAMKTPRFFIRKNTAVSGVEHQRTFNIQNKNVENGKRGLQKSSKNHFVTTCKKKRQNTHKQEIKTNGIRKAHKSILDNLMAKLYGRC